MKLEVLTAPDPILKKKALPVEVVDDSIRKLMDDMLETMYEDKGVGLAANQVGVLKRVLVVDLQNDEETKRPKGFYPLFIANPEIIEASEEFVDAEEGCLSVPDQRIMVSRHYSIKVRYIDYHNKSQELLVEGWLARVIQHEMDHLDGRLLIDYLSNLKKDTVLRKLTKLKKMSA
ncbi:MAG: peptide deformylase [Rickettsiaceae bacterium]